MFRPRAAPRRCDRSSPSWCSNNGVVQSPAAASVCTCGNVLLTSAKTTFRSRPTVSTRARAAGPTTTIASATRTETREARVERRAITRGRANAATIANVTSKIASGRRIQEDRVGDRSAGGAKHRPREWRREHQHHGNVQCGVAGQREIERGRYASAHSCPVDRECCGTKQHRHKNVLPDVCERCPRPRDIATPAEPRPCRSRRRRAGSRRSCGSYEIQPFEQGERNHSAVAAPTPDPVVDENRWGRRASVDRRAIAVECQRYHDQIDVAGASFAENHACSNTTFPSTSWRAALTCSGLPSMTVISALGARSRSTIAVRGNRPPPTTAMRRSGGSSSSNARNALRCTRNTNRCRRGHRSTSPSRASSTRGGRPNRSSHAAAAASGSPPRRAPPAAATPSSARRDTHGARRDSRR